MELTKTPKGTQLTKVRELQVLRTLYGLSTEEKKELLRETVVLETDGDTICTFYFSNASYDLSVDITDPEEGQTAQIESSSAYFASVRISGGSGTAEVAVTGREYVCLLYTSRCV